MRVSARVLQAALRRHARLLDVALGVLVALLSLVSLWNPPEFVAFDFRDPDSLGVVLAVLGGVSVAARGVLPVPALVLANVAALGLVGLGYHQTIGGLPALLTLYTVAVARSLRVSSAALVVVSALVGVVLVAGPLEPTPGDWVGNTLVLLTGWALGRSVRSRRSYAAGLEVRNEALLTAHEAETRVLIVDERSRIAREMQDLVAHSLTTLTVQAAAARRLVRSEPDSAEQLMGQVEDAGRAAMDEMRRILGVLRPDDAPADRAPQPTLDDLTNLIEQSKDDRVEVTLTRSGDPEPLEPGVELTAYRVVQEALDNARQHAGPARVQVLLEWQPRTLIVQVQDDGRGVVSWKKSTPKGHGLQTVSERVQAYGGRLRAGPRGGGGFAVTATLPTAGARS